LQPEYEVLCEWRDLTARGLNARLSAGGFNDVPSNGPLILAAMLYGADARALIRRLGISGPEASQLVETLILRGYLEFLDNPDDPRQPSVVFTKRGQAVLAEAEAGVVASRWAEFPLRPGDIVISTAPKSGTTWMQMICALLVFQTPSLPAPLGKLSPWLDERRGRGEIYAELAAQRHRRFIKTHMPLSDIPIDSGVTYIVVARDPLDAAVSWYHQVSASPTSDKTAVKSGDEGPRESLRQWLLDWIDEMGTRPRGRNSLETQLENLTSAWEQRAKPNVILAHYEELSADLAAEMRRLASHLDIAVPEASWPALVQAATFKEMQAAAEDLQPDAGKGHPSFFRHGSSGEGRSLLTSAEIAQYHTRTAQVAPRDLLTWLHRDK
jgi:DNA-binding MarR family transcriptional regulator